MTCYDVKMWHLVVASNKAIKKFRLSAVQELGIKVTIRCVDVCVSYAHVPGDAAGYISLSTSGTSPCETLKVILSVIHMD